MSPNQCLYNVLEEKKTGERWEGWIGKDDVCVGGGGGGGWGRRGKELELQIILHLSATAVRGYLRY